MKESYGEGLAIHTGPESCGAAREGSVEALTGVRAGRVLSREKAGPLGRQRCPTKREATSGAPISRGAPGSRAVEDPVHVRKHLAREPGDPVFTLGGWRLGTRREV